jgi:hypothetical protein
MQHANTAGSYTKQPYENLRMRAKPRRFDAVVR